MAGSNKVTAGSVLSYMVMPGLLPRARHLFASGFAHLAFLMAHVYAMVRLLPANHPYLRARHIGQFGIRHVIAAAANNLKFTSKNFDQIIVFTALLTGVVLLALQMAAIIYSLIFQPALAQVSFFNTPDPVGGGDLTDVALNLLDRVFGVPEIFCNMNDVCTEYAVSQGGGDAWQTPFHTGLQKLFGFYSTGILIVGVLIFLYYVVVVVGETAMSGTPFGQRFANIWVPIRLVAAIGLLLPLNHSLNSAQYITLYAAKFGSGFATNGWHQFNKAIAESELFDGAQFGEGAANPLGEKESLLAKPQGPDISPVVQFVSLVHACAYGMWKKDADIGAGSPKPPEAGFYIQPYFVKQPIAASSSTAIVQQMTETTSYEQALKFYDNGDIVIRFGIMNPDKYKNDKGFVSPVCGEIRVNTSDVSDTKAGPYMIQAEYYKIIKLLWFTNTKVRELSQCFIDFRSNKGTPMPGCTKTPSARIRQELISDFQGQINMAIQNAWEEYRTSGINAALTEEMFDRGWGGAGIWYNRIAQLNGGFISAVNHTPSVGPDNYPEVMRKVRQAVLVQNSETPPLNVFSPYLSKGKKVENLGDLDLDLAAGLSAFYKYWNGDTANQEDADKLIIGDSFKTAMHFIFGTAGLFNMRGDNASIHPLAQLSALGKGLVDSSIRNVAISSGFAALGGLFGGAGSPKGEQAMEMFSSAIGATAFIGLTAGVILFYVLPFMPFLYFFFAVGEWVKTVFEAMVGTPLWALAHLSLDGDGLPGEAASTGYFLIFDIFFRPIVIVFGLIAAMVVFGAQVRVLNFIWDLVLDNLTGFEDDTFMFLNAPFSRGIIDEFFFTIIYAVIVYMLATASFKLIDSIPDNLLRFMGAGTPTFGDLNKDQIDQINQYAAMGGITVGRQAVSEVTGLARGLGGSAGKLLDWAGRAGGRGGGGGAAGG